MRRCHTGARAPVGSEPCLSSQICRVREGAGARQPAGDDLTRRRASATVQSVDIQLQPEQESKLAEAAARVGVEQAVLVRDAIESYLDYEQWVLDARSKIDVGYAQALRGQVEAGAVVRKRLRSRHDAFLKGR